METKTKTNTKVIDNDQNLVSNNLKVLLANTYTLLIKTQNFHWNVTGPRFSQLHLFFESQYNELFQAVDVVAEQIRILNHRTPASMSQFLSLSTLEESLTSHSENEMLESLLEDHTQIQKEINEWIEQSQENKDEGTTDMLIDRLRAHEKMGWMIKSHLGH